MILKDLYSGVKTQLQQTGSQSPALDARLLISFALNMTHEAFVLNNEQKLSDEEIDTIHHLIEQRVAGKPVAKIIGKKEFYGRDFKTTMDTLDPRPDSETLIETVLKKSDYDKPIVLDLGTGTGCLVLTLLAEMPTARAIAVDQSLAALNVAKENAWTIGVEDRVVFIQSDWFDQVLGQFDIIISNPPYIPQGDIDGLAKDVREYDPMSALVGGVDGLDPYRVIIPQSKTFLKPGGLIVFEVGQGQSDDVATLLENAGFGDVGIVSDLAGIGRVVHGIFLQNPL